MPGWWGREDGHTTSSCSTHTHAADSPLWAYRMAADRVANLGGTITIDGGDEVCTLQALAAIREDLCLLCEADDRLERGPNGVLVCPEPTARQLDARIMAPDLLAAVDDAIADTEDALAEREREEADAADGLADDDLPDAPPPVETSRPARRPRARPAGAPPASADAARAPAADAVGVRRLEDMGGRSQPPARHVAAATHTDPDASTPGSEAHARSTTSDRQPSDTAAGASPRRWPVPPAHAHTDRGPGSVSDARADIERLAAERRAEQAAAFADYRATVDARRATPPDPRGTTSRNRPRREPRARARTQSPSDGTRDMREPTNGPQKGTQRVSAGERPAGSGSRETEVRHTPSDAPARPPRAAQEAADSASRAAAGARAYAAELRETAEAYDPPPAPVDSVDELVLLAARSAGVAVVRGVQRLRSLSLPRRQREPAREPAPEPRALPPTTGEPVSAAHRQFLRDIGAVREEVPDGRRP